MYLLLFRIQDHMVGQYLKQLIHGALIENYHTSLYYIILNNQEMEGPAWMLFILLMSLMNAVSITKCNNWGYFLLITGY